MNNTIGASELAITPQGTIYHLNLRPEQLADTVIIVSDPDRVKEISKYFDRIEDKVQHREFVTHTGYTGNKRISVVATGTGTDTIDIIMNELDALVNIDFSARTIRNEIKPLNIIRLGTSSSLQQEVPADSFVVSDFAVGLDNLMLYYQYENNPEELELLRKFEEHTLLLKRKLSPYIATSSRRLSNLFQHNYHHGITVTAPGFYGPQGRVLRAAVTNAHLIDSLTTFHHNMRIINYEMGTSALYGLGKILGHHCLSVSAITHNRLRKEFTKDAAKAMDELIRQTLTVAEKI